MGEFDWDGVRFVGKHEPLVSRKNWDAVQDLLTGRAPKHRVRQRHGFAFSRLVHCGQCLEEGETRTLIAEQQKGRYTYYRCERCKGLGRPEYVRELRLEDGFVTALETLDGGDERLETLLPIIRPAQAGPRQQPVGKRCGTESQAERLQVKLDRAYDDRISGQISAEYLAHRQREWAAELKTLRAKIAEVAQEQSSN